MTNPSPIAMRTANENDVPRLERQESANGHPAKEHPWRESWPLHGRQIAEFVGAYVLLCAVFVGIGRLIVGPLQHTAIVHNDEHVERWFADHRTHTWNLLSLIGSNLSETWSKILVTLVAAVIMLWCWRRWFEAIVISVALILEASVFVTVTWIVGRPRPDVPRLDGSPIGSSFPSGHVAAAVTYTAIGVVILWHSRNRVVRVLVVSLCVLIPIAVGLARMYRGMHFLSDVVAGALLGGASVIATFLIFDRTPQAAAVESETRPAHAAPTI